MKKILLPLLSALMFFCISANAQHERKQYEYSYIQRFYFKLDKYNIDESLENNAASVDSILYKLRDLKNMGAEGLRVHVIGSASLEASEEYNARLADNRSRAFINFMNRFSLLEGVDMHADNGVYDWNVLYDNVQHSDCPHKADLLRILEIPNADINISDRKKRILALGDGATYKYIAARFFKLMRYCSIRITADKMPSAPVVVDTVKPEPVQVVMEKPKKNFLVGLRTNLLMDVVVMPNIGIDFYVSDKVTLGVNWMYTWIHSDKKSIYWRAYGGDIHADYWFKGKSHSPWTGHHLGVYAQMLTFDFEWKDKGYQAPKWSFGGGINYGYAVSLNRHLSLDFNIGIGYLGGKLYHYDPSEKENEHDKYYKTKSENLKWFGPTKAEISLIWKIGNKK